MTTVKVLGQYDESLKIVDFGKELPNFRVSDAVQFVTDRSTASYLSIENLKDDDVVELIFDGDIHRWVTVAELQQEYKYNLPRGAAPDVIEIPSQLPPVSSTPSPSRGVAGWTLKALRVLKYDPMQTAANGIANAWDDKLMKSPGLYRLDQTGTKLGEALNQLQINITKPVLLFLHGTFSSTQGSFGGLPKEAWARLYKQYGDQIFAFDHRTLSESPIQNALDLVAKLPANAKLHLVTHSRGGLIGELLSRSGRTDGKDAFDEIDLRLVAPYVHEAAGENELVELSNLLKSKNIRVDRFVRIACPARGTTIASGRLDRWVELIVNVLGKVLEPTTGTLFGVLTDLLLDLKKQAANPEAMPGLASMVPESGFIRMINRPDLELDVDLFVIAGDVEKNDILGRLAIFFTDLFYFEDHDLVVQTRAMYGGVRRKNGFYFFHKGTEVNHFHYFSSLKTSEKIVDALIDERMLLESKGFRQLSDAYKGEAIPEIDLVSRSFQKRSNLSQPVVYVVPGIMGTHLKVEGRQHIWLNLLALAQGGILKLEYPKSKIEPYSLVALAYGDLVDYLSATHETIPFPYDWRVSILDEAERFGDAIAAKLKETKQPIRILAHSMGGLVTRTMISRRPDLWDQICQRDGSRFVMLGTPNRGAHKIPRLILGQEQTLRMLAVLDLYNPAMSLLRVIARFPGVLQMLPTYDQDWDFLDAHTWNKFPNPGKLAWVRPLQEDLDTAKRLQDTLNARRITGDDPIIYVAGTSRGAPVEVELSDTGEVVFRGTDEGDGTVPWKSGILPELERRTWYMQAEHGQMANRREYFPAIYDLLHEGNTSLLRHEPETARGLEVAYILPNEKEQAQIYPNQDDLEQIVLGAQPVPLAAPPVQPVKVLVAHGNLAFCNDPVAVGHYEGDGIFSAEKALDYHLDNRLSARHRLGRYPGPDGTAAVVLNSEGRKPGGAIIVGLGKAGELSPRRLTQGFANAMREYAIIAVENSLLGKDGQLAVSTLLIGAGGMGLSVASSVDAILSGVLQANNSFSRLHESIKNVRISEVQFIELYQDQAILAARALRTYKARTEFDVTSPLRSLKGGFQRLFYEEPIGWWSRIYIRTDKENSLIFSLPTGRARTEESQQQLQGNPIESLVAEAVRNPRWDQKAATAMFELMIPNRLKGSFRDLNNIVLVLDQEAAHYPWELIYDRRAGQDKPLVIQVGLIRQFSTSSFQERVVDVKNKNVLVVGNPANASQAFANLPGAEKEASLVEAKFRKYEYQVVSEIHTGSSSIMNSLFANDYRVLHLAGHGVHQYTIKSPETGRETTYTGMVLGNNVFLTANEIGNKMDIPELVFINCCYLGKIDAASETGLGNQEFNKLAASLAQKLIEMGVRAVIAAGWAVDDVAALTFADEFYENMLKGMTFGDAVREARVKTYNLHGDRTNTWAAYQCYGDPAYRLVEAKVGDSWDSDRFDVLGEAISAIQMLSGSAKTTSAAGLALLQQKIGNLHNRIQNECPDWLNDSRLQEALGDAFGEVYQFDDAIKFYESAVKNLNCNASIKTIEQLANLRTREAVSAVERNPNDDEQYTGSKSMIEEQVGILNSLMKTVGASAERWSIIGGSYKRLARISSEREPEVCKKALKEMEDAYEKGWEQTEPKQAYPLINHVLAKLILLLRAKYTGKRKAVPSAVQELAKQAAALAKTEKENAPDDFWASIGCTDAELIEYLIKGLRSSSEDLGEDQLDKLIREYTTTWRRYGSSRELNSVIEHYAFLAAVLKGQKLSEQFQKIRSSLQSIAEH